jgi:aspartate-semialdehyde dehydrogenase
MEVNAAVLSRGTAGPLVAAASGAPATLAAVLKPLDMAAGLRWVSVATYEPASGIGHRGVAELSEQVVRLLNGQSVEPQLFSHQIAFNCIPAVGDLDAEGHSAAERRLVAGLRRLLERPALQVVVTAVRVPVFFGLGIAAAVETERPLGPAAARDILRAAPGLQLPGPDEAPYVTPFDTIGGDAVHVGRVRGDPGRPTALCFWAAIDNVRKGAAVNAVAIAERMVQTAV